MFSSKHLELGHFMFQMPSIQEYCVFIHVLDSQPDEQVFPMKLHLFKCWLSSYCWHTHILDITSMVSVAFLKVEISYS